MAVYLDPLKAFATILLFPLFYSFYGRLKEGLKKLNSQNRKADLECSSITWKMDCCVLLQKIVLQI